MQVVAPVGLLAHPVLRHQDEEGDQHALERDDKGEQAERIGIESAVRGGVQIPQRPCCENADIESEEREPPGCPCDALADGVAEALPLLAETLEIDDRADVAVRWMRVGCRPCRHSHGPLQE